MKPTSNFKMNSVTKYLLSTITDPEARAAFKSNMIQAQLMSEIKPAKDNK
jgi:hypothetical protein